MNTDSLKIPVELNLNDAKTNEIVAKIATEFRARLEKELLTASRSVVEGTLPLIKPSVTGKQQFEAGGKKFEIAGEMGLQFPPTSVLGEAGEKNITAVTKLTATIKEIKERMATGLTAEDVRLKQFKETIKFQPLKFKQDAIKNFITEFGDINNELSARLEKITNTLERQKFSDLKSKLSLLSPAAQIMGYNKYKKEGGALIERANYEIKQSIKAWKDAELTLKRVRFTELQDTIKTLNPNEQIKEIEKYLQTKDALVKKSNES